MIRKAFALLVLISSSGTAARGATVLYADDFEDGKIDDRLIVGNYILEEDGTFAQASELSASEGDGRLIIAGTGNIDIITVEGHYVGWIGKSVYFPIDLPPDGITSIEADLEIRSGVLHGGGTDTGYMAGLTLESREGDRIVFLMEESASAGGKVHGLVLDENDATDQSLQPFPFMGGRPYRLRLEFDSRSKLARGLIDGEVVLELPFHGSAAFSRGGPMATVRTRGDVLEARFDDLAISFQKLAGETGARRSIDFRLEGGVATADVRLDIDLDQGPSTVREKFDPGWSVADVTEGGEAQDAGELLWTEVSARTLSYRLSRDDGYFASAARIDGLLEVGDLAYTIGGDGALGGAVTPFVGEVLATPSFRMGNGLDGCSVRPADVEGPWIGNCLGMSDATIRPAEGLRFRPTYQSRWSQAAGLDGGLSPQARGRFWSNPADPDGSEAVLARVEADDQGRFDWQSDRAFGANIDDTLCVAYFYVVHPEAEPRLYHIGMGSDDSSGIRVNGVPAVTVIGCGGPGCFDGKYGLTLRPGKNLVAFYTFERAGEYNACIRFEDEGGAPVPVRTTLDPTGYTVDGVIDEKDCNGNCVADEDDIGAGTSLDRDGDGVPDECRPIPVDCNRNGSADAEDIAAGRSRDDDRDGIPDECQDAFSLEQVAPFCVAVRLTTTRVTRGGEIGLAYDSTRVVPVCPVVGADFPGSNDDIFCLLEPPVSCALPDGVDRGITIAWIFLGTGRAHPSGSYRLLNLCFLPAPGALPLDLEVPGSVCSPIKFTRCLGVDLAPVENVVTGEDYQTHALFTLDGEVCGEEKPFRRGDSNGDGRFDVSDAIAILGCLFQGDPCPDCRDASDVNDDGAMDISDSIYLLRWRYLGGREPGAPFPGCARDPTADRLVGCDAAGCP